MRPFIRLSINFSALLALITLAGGVANAQRVLASQGVTLVTADMATATAKPPVVACLGAITSIAVLAQRDTAFVTAVQNGNWELCSIDLLTNETTRLNLNLTRTVDDEFGPKVRLAPSKRTGFVTDTAGNRVLSFDTRTLALTSTIDGFDEPTDIAFSSDGRSAFVTNSAVGNTSIQQFETASGLLQRQIFLADSTHRPDEIVLSGDGTKAYVLQRGLQSLALVDLGGGRTQAIGLSHIPVSMVIDRLGRVVFLTGASPDGQTVLMSVSVQRNSEANPVSLGAGAAGPIAISDDGKAVFVSAGASLRQVGTADMQLNNATVALGAPPRSLAGAPPKFTGDVFFLGDSVTAGFGYCGRGDVGNRLQRDCGVDAEFGNGWTSASGLAYPLSYCAPSDVAEVADRCSNNNWPDGAPWDAPAWSGAAGEPTVSYSYQLGARQTGADRAQVRNWAITGSEPADWDAGIPIMDIPSGRFGDQLKTIRNSYVVLTLGANPILSEYLNLTLGGGSLPIAPNLKKGRCSDKVITTIGELKLATPLTTDPPHVGLAAGVGECMVDRWKDNLQDFHLVSIYKTLLENHNRVVVVGYPPVCPWSFGTWQTAISLFGGPEKGYPCNDAERTLDADYPQEGENPQPSGRKISQADQAFYLGDLANGWIAGNVLQAGSPDIVFVPPSQEWKLHQAWNADESWIFKRDTWVHPSGLGHTQIAKSVADAMCMSFKQWCGWDANKLVWRTERP